MCLLTRVSRDPASAPRPACRRAGRVARVATSLWMTWSCAVGAGVVDPAIASPEQTYQLALEARTEGDYRAMLALLRQAAAAGEVAAQELLASVLLLGSGFYGGTVPSARCEALQWGRKAAAQGSLVAQHNLLVLNHLRDLSHKGPGC